MIFIVFTKLARCSIRLIYIFFRNVHWTVDCMKVLITKVLFPSILRLPVS